MKDIKGFQTIDRGWDRIIENLREAGHSFTKVGFPENGKTSGDHSMSEQIEIAITHEFGGGNNIPERSFMRTSMDENIEKVSMLQAQAISAVVSGATTVRKALFGIGEEVKSFIHQKLLQGDAGWPKLKKETVDKKGHAIMLYETGQLRDTVQHEEVIFGVK